MDHKGIGNTPEVNHRQFDSFGNLKSESLPSKKFLYSYTGREWDPDAQLYYYRARWYDPRVGRFLTEDPIYDDAANPYRYVGNSPTNATDPLGLFDFPILITVGGLESTLRRWREMLILERNTEHLPPLQRTYTRIAFPIANEVGVRGVSDFCSPRDALDAHRQSRAEQWVDGVTGSVQLVSTAAGVKVMVMKAPAGAAAAGLADDGLRIVDDGAGGVDELIDFQEIPADSQRTTLELLEEIARRANGKIDGAGRLPLHVGTDKHTYAKNFLDRYQRMFGDRGLSTEVWYCNRRLWESGDGLRGVVKLDVVEGNRANPSRIFDYKFGQSGLDSGRIDDIRRAGGFGSHVPIIQVSP